MWRPGSLCFLALWVHVLCAANLPTFTYFLVNVQIDAVAMALRIERAFGLDMGHELRMQLAYDIASTRARGLDVKRYPPS
jgi:hypothetical protein